jgi:hypothetical protein
MTVHKLSAASFAVTAVKPCVKGYLDDDLPLIFSFYCELWVNIFGKFLML